MFFDVGIALIYFFIVVVSNTVADLAFAFIVVFFVPGVSLVFVIIFEFLDAGVVFFAGLNIVVVLIIILFGTDIFLVAILVVVILGFADFNYFYCCYNNYCYHFLPSRQLHVQSNNRNTRTKM